MTSILDNYNSLQTIFPHQQNKLIPFDTYTIKIRTREYIEIVKQFLLLFDKNNYRDFFSLIIITNYSEIVADDPIINDKNIVELCKTFFNELKDYTKYSELELPNITKKLNIKYDELLNIYQEWKQKDYLIKLDEFIHSYYEFESMYINLAEYKDEENTLELMNKVKQQQLQLLDYIKNLNGIDRLNSMKPVYINMDSFKNITTKAFWDTFVEKIDQENPDYTRLIILLKEMKQLLYSLIPTRQDIHNEINKSIDTDLLLQMIKNKAIDDTEILKIMEYIVSLILRFQAPSEDNNTNEWWSNLKSKYNSSHSYGLFLAEFLQESFKKIESIKIEIDKIKI